jgi:translation elongation factor EF-4
MTYTKPEINLDFNIIPGENIDSMARRIEAAAQRQVAIDIARLKAMGKPIHYKIATTDSKPFSEKLVREEATGQKFEVQIQANGNEKIIGEIL